MKGSTPSQANPAEAGAGAGAGAAGLSPLCCALQGRFGAPEPLHPIFSGHVMPVQSGVSK